MGGLKPLASATLAKRVTPSAMGESAPKGASFKGVMPVSATVWQIWQATQVLQWELPLDDASPAACMAE